MGRKYRSWRHTGVIYIAGFILMLVSGCAFFDAIPSRSSDTEARWQAYLTVSEQLIKTGSLEEARQAAGQMERDMLDEIPPDRIGEDDRFVQLRIQQALLDQLLLNQSRQQFLLDRMDRNWQIRQKTDQSMTVMEKQIADLSTKIKSLEREKQRLEKQIERMKQIDLN